MEEGYPPPAPGADVPRGAAGAAEPQQPAGRAHPLRGPRALRERDLHRKRQPQRLLPGGWPGPVRKR